MKSIYRVLAIVLFITATHSCKTIPVVDSSLPFKEQLTQLFPTASIDAIKTGDHFTEAYQVVMNQPLDPKNPSKGTFKHYMYVSHSSYEQPTVLITDGYASNNRTSELSKVLKGNQIIVEYRMYGKSRPNPLPWEYLTNDNAIEDYHNIVTKMKAIYKGKWLSSGISKGGETTLIYRSKYPKDVDVAVPYVAPIIDGVEDQRTNDLINSVGTDACRLAIKKYQRAILHNREAVLTIMKQHAAAKNMKFTKVPYEEALEYAVLEFPFSFWQWGGKCEAIPAEDASPQELFDYVNTIVGVSFYSDAIFEYYLPSFYQHVKELGYYGFDLEPVKDLLKVVKSATNKRFAPSNVDLTYNPNYIKKVRNYIENKGDKILYIYGAYDPWGACAPSPKPHVDALMMVLDGADHSTRIKHFSKEDQEKIYTKLQEWLGEETTVYPLNK
ncbi:S28 family serine protease [uncultured Kordia sp.]|uniref:S28 family serine protease n=1 Tax=uncultured Kordia sp. TaxID=507699 RepID=UPI002618B9A7|nr:S28 family serine protease [uncultured Kordia sp.]